MRNKIIAVVTLTFVLGAVAVLTTGGAQENAATQAERDALAAERAKLEAERVQRETELRRTETQLRELYRQQGLERQNMERELATARRELEQAARDVARLSAEASGPWVQDMTRNLRYRGQRSMLGISIEDTERGVRVASVSPNGPGAKAGLQIGETILAIDGAQLAAPAGAGKQSPSELLLAQMANVDPGESVKLRMLAENGTERDVTVQAEPFWSFYVFRNGLGQRGPERLVLPGSSGNGFTWYGFPSSAWSDMQLVALTPELGAYFGSPKGLLVVRGPRDDALRLQDGDVILDIGGREPSTPEHAVRILSSFQDGEMLKITVMRKQRRETLEFTVPVDANN
jgi:C-terminal processing protease CtpA/Prc